jgi:hypothetical protein
MNGAGEEVPVFAGYFHLLFIQPVFSELCCHDEIQFELANYTRLN